jgi:hypothetical protein
MSSSHVPPAQQKSVNDDEFGTGLFEEPAPKKAAPAPAPAAAKAPPPAAPAKVEKPADEDDGFGSGLL